MTQEMIEHYEKLAEHYNNLAKLERDKQMSCAPSADEEFYKEQYLEAVALIKKVEEILQWSDEIGLHLSYPAWKLATKIGNAIEPYLMARGELEYYGSKDDDEKQTEINLSIDDHEQRKKLAKQCDNCKYKGRNGCKRKPKDFSDLCMDFDKYEPKNDTAFIKCPNCKHRNNICTFGSPECHFEEELQVYDEFYGDCNYCTHWHRTKDEYPCNECKHNYGSEWEYGEERE